jgi:hypothetical protein
VRAAGFDHQRKREASAGGRKGGLGQGVAADGMSPVAVRIAKSRVLARLRAEAEELID